MPAPAAPTISIIIPTFNEAAGIGPMVEYLRQQAGADEPGAEIIVADGGSTDDTPDRARAAGAWVLTNAPRGRAAQLNHGAAAATGQILYFLHADTRPPASFLTDIRQAIAAGYGSGCYRLQFDHPHWFLRFSAWCTRFDVEAVRFGDQSLFAHRDIFARAGGYREDLLLLEDQEIIRRLRRHGRFRILPGRVVTSARKYLRNGVFRLQGIFTLICVLYRLGVPQAKLVQVYRRMVKGDR